MLKKVWLGLTQLVTVGVLLLFVIMTLKPQWLPTNFGKIPSRSSVNASVDPNANLNIRQAPANLAGLSYSHAVSVAMPSVVRVYATRNNTDQVSLSDKGSGSGVIIDDQGFIVTNQHVIEGATQIVVILNDDRETSAKLVGVDPDNDLAVLKIDLDRLEPITFGNENDLQVGDVVLAIGNPFDVGQSVSMGIVSALHRKELGANTFENFIQTDAAINPGNSGGALINSNGHLVGINEFIVNGNSNTGLAADAGGNAGVGFAVPVGTLKEVAQELIRTGKVSRGYIGVTSQNITPQMAKAFNLLKSDGVIVATVAPKGPAALAGVQVGDILLQIDDVVVTDVPTMIYEVAKLKPNSSAKLTIQRNGQNVQLPISIGERPLVNGGNE